MKKYFIIALSLVLSLMVFTPIFGEHATKYVPGGRVSYYDEPNGPGYTVAYTMLIPDSDLQYPVTVSVGATSYGSSTRTLIVYGGVAISYPDGTNHWHNYYIEYGQPLYR